jgi:hypothetical protein
LERKILLIAVTLYLLVAFNVSLILILAYAVPLDKQVNLSPNQSDVHDAQVFSIDSTVYVFWMDLTLGNDDIYFKKSTDGGASFGDILNLSNDAGDSYDYQVNIPTNDTMYVVWQDETQGVNGTSEIYFKKSTDGGASFADTINLSNNTGDSTDPYVASSNDMNIYVVWRDNSAGTEQIYFKRSTDGGASFGDTINLSDSFNTQSTLPSLTLLNENVYTAWTEGPFNGGEVYYRRSTDGGASFDETVNLSNDTRDSVRPELRVSAPNLFIVWQNQAVKGDDIYFKGSTDGGASFGDTINISNNKGNSMEPEFSVTNTSNVFIVWQNQASNSKPNDILLKNSTDGGATFGDVINLSSTIGNSTEPDIASSNDGEVFAVWTDDTNGEKQVLFTSVK